MVSSTSTCALQEFLKSAYQLGRRGRFYAELAAGLYFGKLDEVVLFQEVMSFPAQALVGPWAPLCSASQGGVSLSMWLPPAVVGFPVSPERINGPASAWGTAQPERNGWLGKKWLFDEQVHGAECPA